MKKKIDTAIIGAGYVGLTLAIYMAMKGSNVIVLDHDEEKISNLKNGKSTIYEEGLNNVFLECISNGKLNFTSDANIVSSNWIIAISYFPGDIKKYIDVLKIIKTDGDKPPAIMIRGTVPLGYTRKFLLPELEKIFLNLISDSGFPGIKFEKKIDFTKLYKEKNN